MSTKIPHTQAEIKRTTELGWQTGVQVYASIKGETVVDFGTGEARPGVSMTSETLVEWGSATKAVTCSAVALLWQRGLIDLDDPICLHIPEFATAGKEAVTIRHLLTHTGGISEVVREIMPYQEAIDEVCRAPLKEGWAPGTRCAYNSVAMWALAEVVARLSNLSFDGFVRVEFFEPLGLHDSWLEMPDEKFSEYGERIAVMPEFALSGTKEWVTWGRPTGGGHGPIGQLGRFYAALLNRQILSAPVVEAMTARHQCGVYDETLDATVERGLGFMQKSSYPGHAYGPYASDRAFGHGGRNWCVAFADPAFDLAAAVYWNGRVDGDTHAERQPKLLDALYQDLGISC
ncbi:beta-lactamase family protein [Chloroflexi bacterium TSY]|nr:beta-lactamase family protein [Chloroflexi bacterium TSY]